MSLRDTRLRVGRDGSSVLPKTCLRLRPLTEYGAAADSELGCWRPCHPLMCLITSNRERRDDDPSPSRGLDPSPVGSDPAEQHCSSGAGEVGRFGPPPGWSRRRATRPALELQGLVRRRNSAATAGSDAALWRPGGLWPHRRPVLRREKLIPGIAGGTVSRRMPSVARATSSGAAWIVQPIPDSTMLGLRMVASRST